MSLKLYQRGEVWHYRGTVAGRRLRGTTGSTVKETAARIVSEIESQEWKRYIDGPQSVLTFAQAVIKYRAAGRPTRFLEKIEDYWKNTLVKDINVGAIKQSAHELYPGTSNATKNRQAIVPTRAVINHAAEANLCPPIRVKLLPITTKIKTPATLEWVTAFQAAASPRLGALALFMFLTGARISEALAVEWRDVDLNARTVLIRQTKIGAERRAHLPAPLVVAIANLQRVSGRSVFFYSSRNATTGAWRRAIERAGIEPLPFHSCRHGFATSLLHAGVDPITVAKLGGWKTPKHVFQTYGHANEDPTLTDLISGTKLTHGSGQKAKKARRIGANKT